MIEKNAMVELAPEVHTFSARIDCRYLLHLPSGSPVDIAVLALHGYGMTAEIMLRLTTALVGPHVPVAALQAPFQHYQVLKGASSTPAYNWGIRDHWSSAARLHHDMVSEAVSMLTQRLGLTPARILLAGFSQSVGLNYRFIGTHPDGVGAVLGLCGGVPRDWEEAKYTAIELPILHICRSEDEFYPPEVVAEFPRRLAAHAANVEFHLLPGLHRFPSKSSPLVRAWMARAFHLEPDSLDRVPSLT